MVVVGVVFLTVGTMLLVVVVVCNSDGCGGDPGGCGGDTVG